MAKTTPPCQDTPPQRGIIPRLCEETAPSVEIAASFPAGTPRKDGRADNEAIHKTGRRGKDHPVLS